MNEPYVDSEVIERATLVANFFWTAVKEIVMGIRKNRIPAHKFCYFGMLLSLLLYTKTDQWVLGLFGKHLHLSHTLRSVLGYMCLASGWIVWGVLRALQRNKILERLKDTFESANLKCVGRYPSLIEDVEIDDHLRCLRLKNNGVTLSEFTAAKEKIAQMLHINIVRFVQDENDNSYVDILYSHKNLAKSAILENPDKFADGEIPIGVSFEGPVSVNIRDVAHILVAGQSGGGKSNFMKLASSIVSANNKEAQIIFLDFKGGMESADLKSRLGNMRGNISFHEGSAECVKELARLGTELGIRLENFKNLSVTDFDQYRKRQLNKSSTTTDVVKAAEEKRVYIFIDEMAQLYSREPGLDKETVVSARVAVNRIARQGRAAGVHLICATQKPDSSSFDQTVKANLPAVLSFPMANQASSVAAVGTKRAFELDPEIKGRAIWKFGPKMLEVQTYKFS